MTVKKFLSILLVLAMLLTLCACGEKKMDIKEVLISGQWHRIDNDLFYYEFYKTGSGSLHSGATSGITTFTVTWTELEDNCIRVEMTPVMGIASIFDYELTEENGTFYLTNVTGNGDNYILKK